MARLVFVVLIAISLAGCGSSGVPTRTPYPLPSGALAVALPTQPPATTPIPSGGFACPLVGPDHVAVVWDRAAHAISFTFDLWGENAQATTILWPRGFSAREYKGRLELVAPDGSVVARDGEAVPNVIGDDPAHVCMVDGVLYQPAG